MSGARGEPSQGALLGSGISRFAQLLAVGFAWAAPLLPAVFVGFGLGTSAHPELARPFAHRGWPLLATMLVLACLGIALVAPLMRRPTRVRIVWLLMPAALAVVAMAPFIAPGRSYPVYLAFWLAAMAIPVVVVALGAAVTTVTFWRRSRWLAIAWPACWLGAVAFLVYATAQTADSGSPAEGLVVALILAVLVVVVVLAATLASTLSSVSSWIVHARHIEQAHRADSQ